MRYLLIITALLLTAILSGCAKTTYHNTTTNPDGSVISFGAELSGNYGIIAQQADRGNVGDGGGGGILGAILPGFGYRDNYSRTFVEAEQGSRVSVTKDGLFVDGPMDHSTGMEIQGNAINRGIRNIATLIGWWKTMGTVESIQLAKETTERLKDSNLTQVELQKLFTEEELAKFAADIEKFKAGAVNEQALLSLSNQAASSAAATEVELAQILNRE